MIEEIKCDNCKKDLTACEDIQFNRLVLKSEKIPLIGGNSLDILILPILDCSKYFCGMSCLLEWAKKYAVFKEIL